MQKIKLPVSYTIRYARKLKPDVVLLQLNTLVF